ncbi:FAD binding domain-containing protein [uncultured Roseobacter sp.]|uniref:FAD binding domain-containing protein n=1 Tax=uncultured Roseobacter sp. TaxID=114847 RepID=UPI00262DFF8A|nr:FAD binding domain-containing protein [uncultured Roseobacter sp.]
MVAVETYQTVAEAAAGLGEGARYLGGGTIVMRQVNYGDQGFHRIVRAARPERGIGNDVQGLRIGAGTTMADILAHAELSFLHPVAGQIGGPAIRNMATVGGNLFAENPYGDMAAALLALDAQVIMAGGQTHPMERFLADRKHMRGLVEAVSLQRPQPGAFYYRKVSRVKPKGVAVITLAALIRGGEPRVVFGNMAAAPMRAHAAERALGGGVSEASIAAACAVCTEGLSPTDDALASAWYRAEVAPVHLRRMLESGGHS